MIDPSSKRTRLGRGIAAALVALSLANPGYTAERRVVLQGHIPTQIQRATMLGRAQANEVVQLSLAVKLDQALLRQTLDGIYGKNAPRRRHYLSSTEFAQLFGLADKRQVLKNFAQANGLTVNAADDQPESMMVKVSGTAGAVENAFGTRLNHYRAADGREFRANEAEPMIPESLTPHLDAVIGLSNLQGAAHPHLRKHNPALAGISGKALIGGGTGIGGFLSPNDIKKIYGLSAATLTGSGQTVAVFELDGYTPSDLTQFEAQYALPNTPVTFIGVDGATNAPGAGAGEVTLDIELIVALAPGLTQILDYTGPNTELGRNATYDRIASDNIARVTSTSWGLNEQDTDPAEINTENGIFQRMAMQGQSIYAAAGDCGAYDQEDNSGNCITTNGFRVDNPASQPFVTGVGGTSLSGTVNSPVETTWNEFAGNRGGGGGGVSAVWPISGANYNYQVGVSGTASSTMRNVPDVALNSDPDTSPYSIYFNGPWAGFGGTSAAAPLWAALTALLNQANAIAGTSTLGFANPTLYQVGPSSSTYASNFTDITTGNNAHYNAQVGYDNATGLGSFKGAALINSLTGVISAITAQQQLESLVNVYAYPNPWDTRKDTARHVTIANVPNDGTVKIYTLSGYWVRTLSPSNLQADWDLTNDAGDHVASGLYFYTVNTPSAKTKGTIAIIK